MVKVLHEDDIINIFHNDHQCIKSIYIQSQLKQAHVHKQVSTTIITEQMSLPLTVMANQMSSALVHNFLVL